MSPWVQLLVGSLAVTGLFAVVAVLLLSRSVRSSRPVGASQEVASASTEAASVPQEMVSDSQVSSPQESGAATSSTRPIEVATKVGGELSQAKSGPGPVEMRIVRGTAMAYEVAVPVSWESRGGPNGHIEHRLEQKGGGLIQIIAHRECEDFTNLIEQMVQGEERGVKKSGKAGAVVIEQEARFEINGRPCIRATIRIGNPDGTVLARRTYVSHAGKEGTFHFSLIETGDSSPDVRREIDTMLASIKLPAPSTEPTDAAPEVRELKGKALPYSIMIPVSWKDSGPVSDEIEYEMARLTVGTLRVAASRRRNAFGNYKSDFLNSIKADAGDKGTAKSKSIRTVVVEGQVFIRHELETQTDEGVPVTMVGFGCDSKEGSLFLIAAYVDKPAPQSTRDEIEAILRSTRIRR